MSEQVDSAAVFWHFLTSACLELLLLPSQAEHMGQHMRLSVQSLEPDGADRLGSIHNSQRGLQISAGSVRRHHQSTQTSLQVCTLACMSMQIEQSGLWQRALPSLCCGAITKPVQM